MSDPMDRIDGLADVHAAIPPMPSEAMLDRVRQRVSIVGRRAEMRAARTRAWRLAGAAAAAVLAIGLVAASPSWENRAFARDEAADALVFARDGRMTHVVMRYTETGWTEEYGHDARYDLDQRTEEWYDPSGERSYRKTINVKDGSLDGVHVRVGGEEMLFQNNVRHGTGSAPQLVGGPTSLAFASGIGMMTDSIRAEIADGHAQVKGTKVVDGVECWVVVLDVNALAVEHGGEKPDPKSSDVITATLRKSDYTITGWSREGVMYNGNGQTTTSQRIWFERWEHVERDAIDEALFSVDAVVKLAPRGTAITRSVDGAAVE